MKAFRWKEPNAFPSLELPALFGPPRPVAHAWRDGPAVILLGHGDCTTSKLTLPFLERLHRLRPAGVTVAAILQDSVEGAREVAGRLDLSLPILVEDDPYPMAATLALRSVPVTWLVGTDGHIRRAMEGFSRVEMEQMAAEAGLTVPFFAPGDTAPARRPG